MKTYLHKTFGCVYHESHVILLSFIFGVNIKFFSRLYLPETIISLIRKQIQAFQVWFSSVN